MNDTIAFIGGGNMSSAIIRGLIDGGRPATSILVAEPNPAHRTALAKTFPGIAVIEQNAPAAAAADVLVLGVKPQVLQTVCDGIRSEVQQKRPLLLSIAAGIDSRTIDRWCGGGLAIMRMMPNQPALLGLGMTGAYPNAACSSEQIELAVQLMAAVGQVIQVEQEADIDTVTAISGSGPAYFYLLVQLLSDQAVASGLSADVSRALAIQTAIGAAAIMRDSDSDLDTLIARVRSPGGTTEAALHYLEQHGFRDTVAGAVNAARARAEQLSRDMSEQ